MDSLYKKNGPGKTRHPHTKKKKLPKDTHLTFIVKN